MALVLLITQTAVAHLEHIGVVPGAGTRVLTEIYVYFINAEHRSPERFYIGSCAPEIARVGCPGPGKVETPFAD